MSLVGGCGVVVGDGDDDDDDDDVDGDDVDGDVVVVAVAGVVVSGVVVVVGVMMTIVIVNLFGCLSGWLVGCVVRLVGLVWLLCDWLCDAWLVG